MDTVSHTQASAQAPTATVHAPLTIKGSLEALPASVLVNILTMLPNPGHIMRSLCLASKGLHATITQHCDGFWEAQAIKAGWSAPRPAGWAHALSAGQHGPGASGQPQAGQPVQWFFYYAHRMNIRKRIRRFLNLYVPFLTRASQLALNPGASLEDLQAAEQRLGVHLPWELFELYRHHNGQAPAPGITFADNTRLLALDELFLESVLLASPSVRHQLLEDVGTRMVALQIPPHLKHTVEPAESPGNRLSTESIKFAESSGRSFLMDTATGAVLMQRGLSTFVTAPSLARFLQKLLT